MTNMTEANSCVIIDNIVNDEMIRILCEHFANKIFNLSLEDFANTDIGYCEIIQPVYDIIDGRFDYDDYFCRVNINRHLEERIHNVIKNLYDDDYCKNEENRKRLDDYFDNFNRNLANNKN